MLWPASSISSVEITSIFCGAEIQRSDILNNAFTNRYESQFTLIAERSSPQLTVEVEFTVSIELEPVVRISGLEDMTIHYTAGSNVDQEQTFCVYGFGTTDFKIGGESTYGSGQFFLSNGNDNIEYGLAVGKAGNSGQGNTEKHLLKVAAMKPTPRGKR